MDSNTFDSNALEKLEKLFQTFVQVFPIDGAIGKKYFPNCPYLL